MKLIKKSTFLFLSCILYIVSCLKYTRKATLDYTLILEKVQLKNDNLINNEMIYELRNYYVFNQTIRQPIFQHNDDYQFDYSNNKSIIDLANKRVNITLYRSNDVNIHKITNSLRGQMANFSPHTSHEALVHNSTLNYTNGQLFNYYSGKCINNSCNNLTENIEFIHSNLNNVNRLSELETQAIDKLSNYTKFLNK